MLSFKPSFLFSSFTLIKRLFSSSSLSAIRVASSAYLRLLIFLLAILPGDRRQRATSSAPPRSAFLWTIPSVSPSSARILGVNRSIAVQREIDGKWVLTAIGKQPADGPVGVVPLGLEGDEQGDRAAHGGVAKAVYPYPREHAGFWRQVRAQAGAAAFDAELPFGLLGENLTTQGLSEERLWVGDRLHLPGCVLAVSAPRRPCYKLNGHFRVTGAATIVDAVEALKAFGTIKH